MDRVFDRDYIITVANGSWSRKCTATALVRQVGIPPRIAARWQQVRREMSPKGLARKIAATRN
jgi:hypothetical protein